MKKSILYSSFIIVFFILSSCKKTPPVIPNEEEIINSITYTLISDNPIDTATFSFVDIDGEGGTPPSIQIDTLLDNTTYTGILSLKNTLSSPAKDITAEIKEEDDEHQFFFKTNRHIRIQYTDQDVNQNPVGLRTTLSTVATGSSPITIILRHKPNKFAPNVAEGDIDEAGGETDIEVSFKAYIKPKI